MNIMAIDTDKLLRERKTLSIAVAGLFGENLVKQEISLN